MAENLPLVIELFSGGAEPFVLKERVVEPKLLHEPIGHLHSYLLGPRVQIIAPVLDLVRKMAAVDLRDFGPRERIGLTLTPTRRTAAVLHPRSLPHPENLKLDSGAGPLLSDN